MLGLLAKIFRGNFAADFTFNKEVNSERGSGLYLLLMSILYIIDGSSMVLLSAAVYYFQGFFYTKSIMT